jgi:hypothetical protein
MIWASRELLPEVFAAWRASRAAVSPSASGNPTAAGPAAPPGRRFGHRHRCGRA